MLVGRSRSLLKVHGLGITSAGTVVIGGGLLVSALTYDLAVSYLAFVGLMMVNEFCLCSAMAEIAVATPGTHVFLLWGATPLSTPGVQIVFVALRCSPIRCSP